MAVKTKKIFKVIKKKPAKKQVKIKAKAIKKKPVKTKSIKKYLIKIKPKPVNESQKMSSRVIVTPIDQLVNLLKQKKELSFNEISSQLNWSIENIEKIGLALEKQGVAHVKYPTLITKNPSIVFLNELLDKKIELPSGNVISSYDFEVDFVPVTVSICNKLDEQRPFYFIFSPRLFPCTRNFLSNLKEEISEKISIDLSEVTDQKKSANLKQKFFEIAREEIKQYFSKMNLDKINILAGIVLHGMYGLGKLETLMGDNNLEEIAINGSSTPVTVYHKKFGWMKSNISIDSEEQIANLASQIGRKAGREISTLNPILDAHLSSGDRVNATFLPISSFGNTITIRRFARRPWTIIDFISGDAQSMNLEMASLLWMAMQYEMNVIVAGGTASGKTTTLNVLASLIPSYHRIISIEDVREIMLPKPMHWNWVALTTRNANPENLGEVAMLELMQSSLRMRPDRIIVGEIRRQREAEVLFEAMHTGHSVYSTIHANSTSEVLRRLTEAPISIPKLEIEAIDLLVVQYRDRKRNIRKTFEISEIETGVEETQLNVNTIFKWNARDDSWENLNPATRFVRQLNLHTGMTEDEIVKELNERAQILEWMQQNDLRDIEQVGRVMKLFYANPDLIKNAAKKKLSPKEVLE